MEGNGECLDDAQVKDNLDDEVVQEVLKTGTDLRQYSRQVEKELKEVENKSIKDYIKESQNIASLHNQIAACDSILEVRKDITVVMWIWMEGVSKMLFRWSNKTCDCGPDIPLFLPSVRCNIFKNIYSLAQQFIYMEIMWV